MSSKVQINCSKTNQLFTNILKEYWKMNSRITKDIEYLQEARNNELKNLSHIQIETKEYYKQIIKIDRLNMRIKDLEKTINRNLESIELISSILTRITC